MDRSGTTENKTLCFYNHSAGVGEFWGKLMGICC
jgi:hypothetical protein